MVNCADLDQTAPSGAVRSGSSLFAQSNLFKSVLIFSVFMVFHLHQSYRNSCFLHKVQAAP